MEVQKIGNCRYVSVISIVIGALGTISKRLKEVNQQFGNTWDHRIAPESFFGANS